MATNRTAMDTPRQEPLCMNLGIYDKAQNFCNAASPRWPSGCCWPGPCFSLTSSAPPLSFSHTHPPSLSQGLCTCSLFCWKPVSPHFLSFFFIIFIYLAALGLSCGTSDLCCIMGEVFIQRINSLVVVHGLSPPESCEILVP